MTRASSHECVHPFLLWAGGNNADLDSVPVSLAATLYKSLATSWQVGTLVLSLPLRVYGYK